MHHSLAILTAVYPGFVTSVCNLPTCCLFVSKKDIMIRFYEGGVHIFQRKSFGGSVSFRKIVWAHDFRGVQIFQRGSKFSSKISSGGSIFFEKLVPGGTNFGGSIFTVTGPPFLFHNIAVTCTCMLSMQQFCTQTRVLNLKSVAEAL